MDVNGSCGKFKVEVTAVGKGHRFLKHSNKLIVDKNKLCV